MQKDFIDWSKVHILALFRQYFAITLAQWRFNHALAHNWIKVPAKDSGKANQEYTNSANIVLQEINKRLNLNPTQEDYRAKFMDWYRANEEFINSLDEIEYAKFEFVENNYIATDFADSTEFETIVNDFKYDEFIASHLETDVTITK